MTSRIGILTSGGDAPGMNAAIRAATLYAISKGSEVIGIQQGYRGLIEGQLRPLSAEEVAHIGRDGGTILGSARCLEFHQVSTRDTARRVLEQHGITGLVAIGGNGTLTGARALTDPSEIGNCTTKVIGIPGSIDNDIGHTAYAIGVDTALNTIVDACDKISDTATAHERTFIVEVMGRDSGYLAMASGIASSADAVLFRESGKSEEEIVDAVAKIVMKARSRQGRSKRVLVIKAEGLGIHTDKLKERVDAKVSTMVGKPVDQTRVTVLGHVVRGGRPSSFDRLLASRLAHTAVRAILNGETRKLSGWAIPGPVPSGARAAEWDPHCWLVDLEAVLAETSRLLDGSSHAVKRRAKMFDEIADVLAL
jgi:6-phosphofructokinase 1